MLPLRIACLLLFAVQLQPVLFCFVPQGMLTAICHAGAAGLKLVEIPELSESKATADSPISAHTKVSHSSCPCPAAVLQYSVTQRDRWRSQHWSE